MNINQFFRDHPEFAAVARDYDDSPVALLGDPTTRMIPRVGYHCCGDPGWDWVSHRGIVTIREPLPEGFPAPGDPKNSLLLRPV